MKKTAQHQNQFIFSIYAEDKKGLLGHILIYFNRSSYHVQCLNVSRTDISDLILITLEAEVPAPALNSFTEKLKKIIEVYSVTTYPAGELLKKIGFYRMCLEALDNSLWNLMAKYGATISSLGETSFVISKTGMDKDLAELYSLLEGPFLIGFCKSGLIVEESLVQFDAL